MGDFWYLIQRAWRSSKRFYGIAAAKSLFTALVPLLDVAGLGIIINALVTNQSYAQIMKWVLLFVGANLAIKLLEELLRWRFIVELRIVSNVIAFDYTKDSLYVDYHHVHTNSLESLRQHSMGVDPGSFVMFLGDMLSYLIQFAGIFTALFALAPPFVLVLILVSTLLMLLSLLLRKNEFLQKEQSIEGDRKLDYLYRVMTDYTYAKEVRLNQGDRYVEGKYTSQLSRHLGKIRRFYRRALAINTFSTLLSILQTAAMYLYFSYLVFQGNITIAQYSVLLGVATMFHAIILGCSDTIAQLRQRCNYVKSYKEYVAIVAEKSTITNSNRQPEQDIDFSKATYAFQHVSFAYPGAETNALEDIDLVINPGERLGIVGINGSGKSTFVKLLTRIYDPTDGVVTVNGQDIRQLPYDQLSRHTAVLLQDFFLFAYSIRENIVFDGTCDEERLSESIRKSGLQAKVEGLPQGMNTAVYKELDDNGVEFSGGEGQKLALARAIYKDAELLIMDEPTSSLDPIAEYELFSRLDELAVDKTAIFISHRLSSTQFCDRVLVFDGGRIVESGSHRQLMEQDGLYAQLFQAQAQYYQKAKEAAL